MKTYVIMKQMYSPIYRTEPKPHLIVGSLKEAKERCLELERKAHRNEYWYQPCKNTLS